MGNKQDKESEVNEELEESHEKVSYWQMMTGGYSELVNAIIRPPRAQYDDESLGPTIFRVNGEKWIRKDLQLVNKRGLKLECSHWFPENIKPMPVIIYLHGNASCRVECLECLPLVASAGLMLFSFDCSGSGKSEGEYISLGWHEREDVATVVEYLRDSGMVSTIGLWGRSMGAVTALMFGDRDPTIACMVLDSPFANLRQLAKELVDHAQISLPKIAIGIALKLVRNSVKSRAGFDINKLDPIKHADRCFIPALFGAAEDDLFIPPHHSKQIFDVYAGDKNLITFDGDHNSVRPQFFSASVGIFLYNTMVVPCQNRNSSKGEYGNNSSYAMPSESGVEESLQRTQPYGSTYERYERLDGTGQDAYEEAMLIHALELSLAESAENNDDTPLEDANDASRLEDSIEDSCLEDKVSSDSCKMNLGNENDAGFRELVPLEDPQPSSKMSAVPKCNNGLNNEDSIHVNATSIADRSNPPEVFEK